MAKREIGEILDDILELLKDGEWHELWGSIRNTNSIARRKSHTSPDFLVYYGWIEYNSQKKR